MSLVGAGLTWAAWSAGEERGYYRGVQYQALAAQSATPVPTYTPTADERRQECYRLPTDTGVSSCLAALRGPNPLVIPVR